MLKYTQKNVDNTEKSNTKNTQNTQTKPYTKHREKISKNKHKANA